MNEIVARIQAEAFDDLDAPVGRVGAAPGISPQAEALEKAFLPTPATSWPPSPPSSDRPP